MCPGILYHRLRLTDVAKKLPCAKYIFHASGKTKPRDSLAITGPESRAL